MFDDSVHVQYELMLQTSSIEIAFFTGCRNTPAKSSRFCECHKNWASAYTDDSQLMIEGCENKVMF